MLRGSFEGAVRVVCMKRRDEGADALGTDIPAVRGARMLRVLRPRDTGRMCSLVRVGDTVRRRRLEVVEAGPVSSLPAGILEVLRAGRERTETAFAGPYLTLGGRTRALRRCGVLSDLEASKPEGSS